MTFPLVDSVNVLSSFLAFEEELRGVADVNRFHESLSPLAIEAADLPTDVIVLCGSAILSLGDDVFTAVSGVNASGQKSERFTCTGRNLVVVICGGIGHSTPFMYEAVARHEKYSVLADEIKGLPEARVFQRIAERWYGLPIQATPPAEGLLSIIIEDQSTNCGANAIEAKKTLDLFGVRSPRSVIVVQDATMSRRTVAAFEKAYLELGASKPKIVAWPTFVPEVRQKATAGDLAKTQSPVDILEFSANGPTGARRDGLWKMSRFVDLLVGEIPRLRDDENGYGPKGEGFIPHVDVPDQVEEAWAVLSQILGTTDRPRHR